MFFSTLVHVVAERLTFICRGRSPTGSDIPSDHKFTVTNSGLDSRYMISKLRPTEFKIQSLTTIATPHRGLESHVSRYLGQKKTDKFMQALQLQMILWDISTKIVCRIL